MDYNYLYKKLNNRTPLKMDCGKLCNNACCVDVDGDEMGMYLFPGEEKMFEGKENFKIEESELGLMDKKVKILFCKPYCKRSERPLACRIFPLFPYIDLMGELKIIIDPRGRSICPLYKGEVRDLSGPFVRGVTHIGEILANDQECFEYLFSLSRYIDEYVNDVVEGLKKYI